jgi:hypothetical protein
MAENGVLRRIIGVTSREEITRATLHNEKLNNFYSSSKNLSLA